MTTSSPMTSWADIAAMPPGEQSAKIAPTYESLAAMPEADRTARLAELESGLYRLSDDQVHSFQRARLRTLLDAPASVTEAMVEPNNRLVDLLPGPVAMKHLGSIQAAVRDFTAEEQGRLKDMFPKVLESKSDVVKAAGSATTAPAAPTPITAARTGKSKPWWAFWKAG